MNYSSTIIKYITLKFKSTSVFITLFTFSVILFFLTSCKKDNAIDPKLQIDVSAIDAKASINRFEKAFYNGKPADLEKIKKEYRYFFPHDVDSIWLKKMTDADEQELFRATQKVYPNLDVQEEKIATLFKHIKHYYPTFKEPQIVSLNSNVDFDNKVVYTDSLLFISLDVFLGENNKIYQDYPPYLKQNFAKEQLVVATAKALAKPIISNSKDRTFLAKMIQQGKLMYVLDAYLPKVDDAQKMTYTAKQLQWVTANEKMIWQYFVENKILFDTDLKLDKRFIEDAPFSKFYLDIDNESPGRIGVWMGWQIVRSYMNHNEVTLKELMKLENELIYKKSKYKP